MILSRGRRFIFIHIPKTGGTALTRALEARAMKDDILIGDTPKARARKFRLAGLKSQGRLWKHATLSDIAGLASDAEIANFFTLTLVRNPWDRAVSYYHWLHDQSFAHPAVGLAKSLTFSAWPWLPSLCRRARPRKPGVKPVALGCQVAQQGRGSEPCTMRRQPIANRHGLGRADHVEP